MTMKKTKDQFIEYVEERLQQWAEWFSAGNFYGVGFPRCSIEYRIMTEGHVIRSTAEKSFQINSEAEEIEEMVNEMAIQNKNMALALRCHYFTQGSLRFKAKKAEISHMQFKYYVDMAHQWLVGRFSAYQNFTCVQSFQNKKQQAKLITK